MIFKINLQYRIDELEMRSDRIEDPICGFDGRVTSLEVSRSVRSDSQPEYKPGILIKDITKELLIHLNLEFKRVDRTNVEIKEKK